jgi:phosphotransferase system enzyme I (PtsI)
MATFSLHGISVSRGIAIGHAHLLTPISLEVQHYLLAKEEIEQEVVRLNQALAAVRCELQTIWDDLPADAPTELGAFINVHLLILSDPMLCEAPIEMIRTQHYNAEWALTTQVDLLSAQFDEMDDPYLRVRKLDILQVAERILKVLSTGKATSLDITLTREDSEESLIIVAHDVAPADMMQFRHTAFHGFVTDLGGQNSHTALVARSLDIAAVVGAGNATRLIRQNDLLIIDGETGIVIVNPSETVLQQYRAQYLQQIKEKELLNQLKSTPAVTIDGTPVNLFANIELAEDCEAALDMGAVGIGLFRSEFLFIGRNGHVNELSSEEEQFIAYQKAVLSMKGCPVTIRTLDLGADKELDGMEQTSQNPALGLRAIRYCMTEPQLFLTQLRALLRASAFGPVQILIPMLSHVFEIEQTLNLIQQAKQQLIAENQAFDTNIKVGAMIEIPAAALAISAFIKRLDFLSIGTNDLIQYTLAIDRVDHEVAHLYDPVHPAVLMLLKMTLTAANAASIPVAICGGIAGDSTLTRFLLGMGFRNLSMPAAAILSVKREVLHCDLEKVRPLSQAILASDEPSQIKVLLEQIAAL